MYTILLIKKYIDGSEMRLQIEKNQDLKLNMRWFLVALCHMIVRRPNLDVAMKRLLHQHIKIPG